MITTSRAARRAALTLMALASLALVPPPDAAASRRALPRAGDDGATKPGRDERTSPVRQRSRASRLETRASRLGTSTARRSPSVADYARAGRNVGPVAPRPRIAPALRDALDVARGKEAAAKAFDVIDVRLVALPGRSDALLAGIGARGGAVQAVSGPVIRASVSTRALESLLTPGLVRAASLDTRRTRPAARAGSAEVTKTGAVESAGVGISGADEWQGTDTSVYGLERATPVRVAILDFGFAGYTALLGSELPPTVDEFFPAGWDIEGCGSGLPGCIPDGTAMAEIVADMAPDAELVLVAVDTEDLAGVRQAADFLRSGGPGSSPAADLVVSGLAWQPGLWGDAFGNGPIADIVGQVTGAGIPWINDVGDRDFLSLLFYNFVPAVSNHWHGSFADEVDHLFGGVFDDDGYMDAWFAEDDPAAGETWLNPFCLGSMDVLLLDLVWDDWNDPDGNGDPAPSQDYSIDIYEDLGGGNVQFFDSSANYFGNDQTGVEGQFPWDSLDVVNTGATEVCFFITVFAEGADGNNRFHLYWGGDNDAAFGTVTGSFAGPGSLTEGDRVIPADAPETVSVAVTDLADGLRDYTTSGLPGEEAPALCAQDDAQTVSLAGGLLTSFGAAHVAGAVALLMHKVSSLDAGSALDVLAARARPVLPGSDTRCGAGRLCTLTGGCPLPN